MNQRFKSKWNNKTSIVNNISKWIFLELCHKFLPQQLVAFIIGRTLLNQKQRCVYNKEYKQFALSLYFASPKSYRMLSNTFKLPSKRTTERFTERWPHCSGLNDFIFEAIKLNIQHFNKRENECVRELDEMSIKSFLSLNSKMDKITGFNDIGSANRHQQNMR